MEGIVDTHPEPVVEEPEITSAATMGSGGPVEPTATADGSGGGDGSEASCAWSLTFEQQVENLMENLKRVFDWYFTSLGSLPLRLQIQRRLKRQVLFQYGISRICIAKAKIEEVVSQLLVDLSSDSYKFEIDDERVLEEDGCRLIMRVLDLAILMGDSKIVQKILERSYGQLRRLQKLKILLPSGWASELSYNGWASKLSHSGWASKDVEDTEKTDLTPLHLAVAGGYSDIVDMLLKEGVDVNAQNLRHHSPLDFACKLGNVDMLLKLLEKDVYVRDPTHVAMGNGDVDFMKKLPSPNVNAKDKYGKTPLHYLATQVFLELGVMTNFVKYFAQDKALDLKVLDSENLSVFYVAVLCCNTELVVALLDSFKNEIRLNEACHHDFGPPIQIAFEGREAFKDIQRALMECDPIKSYMEMLYRDRQVYVDAANAILVGAALIASVTFASWLQPPLNYTSYFGEGDSSSIPTASTSTLNYVDAEHNIPLRAFWVFNAFSFYFAIATVVCGARSVLPRSHLFIKKIVEKLRTNLLVTSILLACSVLFVIIAFAIAETIVLTPILKYQWCMIVPSLIGGMVCIISLVFLIKNIREIFSSSHPNSKGVSKGKVYLESKRYVCDKFK